MHPRLAEHFIHFIAFPVSGLVAGDAEKPKWQDRSLTAATSRCHPRAWHATERANATLHQNRAIKINTKINEGRKNKERARRQPSAKGHRIRPKPAALTHLPSKEGRRITRKLEIPRYQSDNNLLHSLLHCYKDFLQLGGGFCFFSTKPPLEIQILSVCQIRAWGRRSFPTDGLPCRGGRCYLWCVMLVAKKKKGKMRIQLRKPLSPLQEVCGGGFMAYLMDISPTGCQGKGASLQLQNNSTHAPHHLIFYINLICGNTSAFLEIKPETNHKKSSNINPWIKNRFYNLFIQQLILQTVTSVSRIHSHIPLLLLKANGTRAHVTSYPCDFSPFWNVAK